VISGRIYHLVWFVLEFSCNQRWVSALIPTNCCVPWWAVYGFHTATSV